MGLFGLFKRKKRQAKEEPVESFFSGNEENDINELSVPEYNNNFLFKKPYYKNVKDESAMTVKRPKRNIAKNKFKVKSNNQRKEETQTSNCKKSNSKAAEQNMQNRNMTKQDISSDESTTQRTGKFEIKKTKDSRYVFNLYASNHVIVATSQIYSSVQSAMNGIKSVVANSSRAVIEDQTIKDYKRLPYPKWEIYLDNAKQYRFRLCAANGSCVCHSQGYTKKSNCKSGIESIQKFAPTARIDKAYIKKEGTK